MTTPYFVPSDDLLHAFARRRSAGWMSVLSFREKMIDAGRLGQSRILYGTACCWGKIYQFEGGLLHTKSVLVDGD